MRALLAACLALALALAVGLGAASHAHGSGEDHGPTRCAVCAVRAADLPAGALPDPAADDAPAGEVAVSRPAVPPVTGAPQGAIPGQSPPA